MRKQLPYLLFQKCLPNPGCFGKFCDVLPGSTLIMVQSFRIPPWTISGFLFVLSAYFLGISHEILPSCFPSINQVWVHSLVYMLQLGCFPPFDSAPPPRGGVFISVPFFGRHYVNNRNVCLKIIGIWQIHEILTFLKVPKDMNKCLPELLFWHKPEEGNCFKGFEPVQVWIKFNEWTM